MAPLLKRILPSPLLLIALCCCASNAAAVVSINKLFVPTAVDPGDTSTLTITLYNANMNTLIDIQVTDNLPSGMEVATSPNVTNSCSGSVSATAGSGSVTLTGGTVAAATGSTNGECTITVDVVSETSGNLINTIAAGGMDGIIDDGANPPNHDSNINSASATLQVSSQQAIAGAKTFSPATIAAGGGRTLMEIRLDNNNAYDQPDVAFTDTFPSGMTVAPDQTGAIPNTCGGTLTAVPGSGTVSLSGGTISLGTPGSCTIQVYVEASAVGDYSNSIPVGGITSGRGTGASNISPLEANLSVQEQLDVKKSFSPNRVSVGQPTTLTVTVYNYSSAAATNLSVTDNLPAPIQVYDPPNASTNCGGTFSPGAADTTLTLTSGSLGAAINGVPTSCQFQVNVEFPVDPGGNKTNRISAGQATADLVEGGSIQNQTDATARLRFDANAGNIITVQKFWRVGGALLSELTVNPGDSVQLDLRVQMRNNDSNLTNNSITDTLPPGLVVAAPANPRIVNQTWCDESNAAITAVPGSSTITYSGFVLEPRDDIRQASTCRIRVDVTSSTSGTYTNQIPANSLTNTEDITNAHPSNEIHLGVPTGVELAKTFSPDVLTDGGRARLVIEVTNNNSFVLTNTAFTDTLPSGNQNRGVIVATPSNAATTCTGGTVTAAAGSDIISLTGATVPAEIGGQVGLCTVAVDVAVNLPSNGNAYSLTNTIPIGAMTSNEGISNATAAVDEISYEPLLVEIVKSFSPLQINTGQSSTLTVKLTNPSSTATLTGLSFTDNMPGEMFVFSSPSPTTDCGGVVSATPGSNSWSFSDGTLGPLGVCFVTLKVTAVIDGNSTNTIAAGAVTTDNGASSDQATSATLTVLPRTTVTKGFNPPLIAADSTSHLVITIVSGSSDLTTLAVTDNLPAGVVVADPNNLSTSCALGTLAASPGSTSVSLQGSSLAASSSCQIEVDVTASATGSYVNTIGINDVVVVPGTIDVGEATDTLVVVDPTLAVISRVFAASDAQGAVSIGWETSMEVGTLGFHLERWDASLARWERVTDERVPSLTMLGAPQGGTYIHSDEGAVSGERYRYRLLEEEVWGGERTHGPFQVTVDGTGTASMAGVRNKARTAGRGLSSASDDATEMVRSARYRALARKVERRSRRMAQNLKQRGRTAGDASASVSAQRAQGVTLARPGPARLEISADGLYAVSAASIADALGERLSRVRRWIGRGRLTLSSRGQAVAWEATGAGEGIRFHGEAPAENPYSDINVYWIERGKGRGIAAVSGGVEAAVEGQSYRAEQRIEEDSFAITATASDPESDYWRWAAIKGGDALRGSIATDVKLHDVVSDGPASLRLDVQSIRDVGNTVIVRINGTELDASAVWDGIGEYSATLPIPADVLVSGVNSVEIEAQVGIGGDSYVYLDGFTLGYERQAIARDGRLALSAEYSGAYSLDGFGNADIAVYRLGAQPEQLVDLLIDQGADGNRVSFASQAGERYLAVEAGAERGVDAVASAKVRFRKRDQIDYLVIAERSLTDGAQRLADHRANSGLRTRVVTVDDIAVETNHGLSSPHNTRAFLGWAQANWGVRYAVLAGSACVDYKDRAGLCDDLVSSLMVATPYGLYACDSCLGDTDGDSLPNVLVSRIPAEQDSELQAYIDKLIAYESQLPTQRSVLLVADHYDEEAGDFTADSEARAEQLTLDAPDVTVQTLYLDDIDIAGARGTLLPRLGQAGLWSNYIGHGGGTNLSKSGLLTHEDTALISGGSGVLSAMTCLINMHDSPYFQSLGESLVLDPDGGPVVVIGPSGLSENALAMQLNAALLDEVFVGGQPVLGDAIGETMHRNGDMPAWMRQIYSIMGDVYVVLP